MTHGTPRYGERIIGSGTIFCELLEDDVDGGLPVLRAEDKAAAR
ncbi:hypothetical protein [Streptomyces sp. ISL-66]|nr:hypothetical protein [Streptomyces sp. ISL-66]